jgi:hypothetical protein
MFPTPKADIKQHLAIDMCKIPLRCRIRELKLLERSLTPPDAEASKKRLKKLWLQYTMGTKKSERWVRQETLHNNETTPQYLRMHTVQSLTNANAVEIKKN